MATVCVPGGAGASGSVAVRDHPAPGRGPSVVLAALTLLLASCTGTGEAPSAAPVAPDPRVDGEVLLRTGFGNALAIVELPDVAPVPLRMPDYERMLTGFFDPDGNVVAVVAMPGGEVGLYRVAREAEPVPIGPALPYADTFSAAGGSVLATGCGVEPFARVLVLDTPDRWRTVDAGCGATLSPDAAWAAWSPDETEVVRAPVGGGRAPLPVLEIGDLPVPAALEGEAGFVGPLAWGDGGEQAVLVAGGGWQGAAVTGSAPTLDPLGDHGAGPAYAILDWQPGGSLLAVASTTAVGGVVRVFEAAGGSRVVAMFGMPVTGAVWSPDGRALLATSNSTWAVVAPDGTWLWSRLVDRGQEPLDWWAPA